MKRILAALYIICVVLLCACTDSHEQRRRLSLAERQRQKTADSLALKIAVMPTADCFPVFVAQDRGLFDTARVDIRLRGYTAQMDCDTALAGRSVEGAFSDLMRTERLIGKGVALDYLLATNLYWQLVSNKKARVGKPQQLSDKTMGMTRFSATDYLSDVALKGVEMQSQAFRLQVNDVHIRLSMLQNSELDAAWLPEPQATAALSAGHKSIADSRKDKQSFGVVAFHTKALKDKRIRGQVDAFIEGYNQACDSLNKYGVAHYASLLNRYCKVDEKCYDQLSKLRYEHARKPAEADVETARKYAKNTR